MTSPHPFSSLFFELRSNGGELGTCLFVVLYLAGLYKGAKLEVEAKTGLICWRCRDIIGLNAIAFTGDGARDMQADLSAAEDAINANTIGDLLYFVYDDGRRNKVLSVITDLFRGETFLTIPFWRSNLWSTPETIIIILLKLIQRILDRRSLIFNFIFRLYIFELTNLNVIRFDLIDYFYILGMFDDANNTSKKGQLEKQ